MSNLHEYEFNNELFNEFEYEGEGEYANELMAVSNEYELEGFLGKVWDAAKRFGASPEGQNIKKDFIAGAKSFGRQMFPSIGKNIGGYIGGAGGAVAGGKAGDWAGKWLFGNQEMEGEAVDYVRVIRKAANYLNRALGTGVSAPPRTLVTQAINQAARPILTKRRQQLQQQPQQQQGTLSYSGTQNQGRWIRQGNRLIIQGAR